MLDEQVRKLVDQGYQRARKVIEDHADAMERIALALLEREVLDGAEVRQLIAGQPLSAYVPPPTIPPPSDGTQEVIKPEGGRRMPNMLEGGPQPA